MCVRERKRNREREREGDREREREDFRAQIWSQFLNPWDYPMKKKQ